MEGYLKIYTKNNIVGHVRYEIGDDRGYKEIRGLSISKFYNGNTIYEKGEEDSHGISIYNTKEYSSSPKIPLSREELIGAMVYTRENDEQHKEYGLLTQNCNDFTARVLSAAKQKGCVGDYLSAEQKSNMHLSQASDFIKCKIPQKLEEKVETIKNNSQKISEQFSKIRCSGIVTVGSYIRDGQKIEGYTRNCGRH